MCASVWKKQCPKCKCEQVYSCKSILTLSIKKNTWCNQCRFKNNRKFQTEKLERICSCGNSMIYKSYLIYKRAVNGNWECKKCATKKSAKLIDRTYQITDEYRKMMSKKIKNARKRSFKYNTEEYKEKLRVAKLNQIKKLGSQHNFNPNACKFIEEFGKKRGYNFQHALNGGEIIVSGYSLDGYDKDRNIVFEYDERKHHAPSVKKNDKLRQDRIIKKINPKMFIRYDECFNKIHDVISGKEL